MITDLQFFIFAILTLFLLIVISFAYEIWRDHSDTEKRLRELRERVVEGRLGVQGVELLRPEVVEGLRELPQLETGQQQEERCERSVITDL